MGRKRITFKIKFVFCDTTNKKINFKIPHKKKEFTFEIIQLAYVAMCSHQYSVVRKDGSRNKKLEWHLILPYICAYILTRTLKHTRKHNPNPPKNQF